jgi:hypothetical protein
MTSLMYSGVHEAQIYLYCMNEAQQAGGHIYCILLPPRQTPCHTLAIEAIHYALYSFLSWHQLAGLRVVCVPVSTFLTPPHS